MKIVPFLEKYVSSAKKFADRAIGENYFSEEDLVQAIERSSKAGLNASFVLLNDSDDVMGFRLSYPPGKWMNLKSKSKICPELWKVAPEDMAYFQSIFLDKSIHRGGWGQKLSTRSLEVLKEMGAKGVVCHSWKESPNNSSMRYLEKMGFQALKEHENYWKEVDYICVRCGKPCLCTATEMVFYL